MYTYFSGTDIECVYNLMTFGIPKDVFPINADGSLNLSHHYSMLAMLKCREEKANQDNSHAADSSSPGPSTSTNSPTSNGESGSPTPTDVGDDSVLVLPGPMDIILGKGRHPKSSAGSLRMHNLLHEHAEEYEAAAKFDKTIIGDIILRKLELHGCRFLKPMPTGFQICDESVTRAKISHAFRNMRVKQLRKMSAQAGQDRKVGRAAEDKTKAPLTLSKRGRPQ
jgi:hypothetical protein